MDKTVVALVFLFSLLPTHSEAAWWSCSSMISGRIDQQALISTSLAIGRQTAFFHGTSGRQLSTTSAALADISDVIDLFLGMNSVSAIVERYNQTIRTAEYAFLQRKQNLEIISLLESQQEFVRETESWTAANYDRLRSRWKKYKLDPSDDADRFALMTSEEVRRWITAKLALLKSENISHERVMGRTFLEWRQVRQHLHDLIYRGDRYLLDNLEAHDGRKAELPPSKALSRGLAAGVLESVSEDPKLPEKKLSQQEYVERELSRLGVNINRISEFLGAVENFAGLDFVPLKQFLTENQYSNDSFDAIVSRGIAAKGVEGDAEKLQAELRLLRLRLRDVRTLMEGANTADQALGLNDGDFSMSAEVLPEDGKRPSLSEFADAVYKSPYAQRARQRTERIRSVLAFVDGNLGYGKIGALLPRVGQTADSIGLPSVRTFLYLLFEDLYLQHVRKNYFPSLTLLRKSGGGAQKLRRDLEILNAGTNDEMLLVFSRRADLAPLWNLIRGEAEHTKDEDHFKLYYRMIACEKRVQGKRVTTKSEGAAEGAEPEVSYAGGMGTISLIDGSSYTRYVFAAALNGALLYGGSHFIRWWVSDNRVPTPQPWYKKLMNAFIKEAVAAGTRSGGWALTPEEWNEETEEYALANLETVVYGLAGIIRVSPSEIVQATRRLMALEMKLSHRSEAELLH